MTGQKPIYFKEGGLFPTHSRFLGGPETPSGMPRFAVKRKNESTEAAPDPLY